MDEKQILEQIQAEFAGFMSKAKEEMKSLGSVQSETNTSLEALRTRMNDIVAYQQKPASGAQESKSLGQLFVEDPRLKEFGDNYRPNVNIGIKVDGPLFPLSQKTTITSGTVGSSTPGILVPERVADYVRAPARRVRVRNLIPFGTTSNNAVEYVKRNAFTNAASPISEGSTKPESALTFTIASANVRTIASWLPVSAQVREDWPQLQDIINTELLEGLADVEDHELLRGDNTDQHLNGLITQATAFAGTYSAASDNYIDQVACAMMELEANNYAPDGLIVHPSDWRKMLKLKDNVGGANTGQYLLGGPAVTTAERIWTMPVVPTTAMVAGTFLVGQFVGSVRGYDRMQASVAISSEHASYFVQNLLACRVEERICIAVFRPDSFRYGSFS